MSLANIINSETKVYTFSQVELREVHMPTIITKIYLYDNIFQEGSY